MVTVPSVVTVGHSRRTSKRPVVALTAAALSLAVPALTGCSNSASSAAAPPSGRTTKAATSAAPSPVAASTYQAPATAPTALPVTTVDETQAGIFILVWVETLNYGYAHSDANPLRQSISLGCFTCANWVIDVQTHENNGITQVGGAVHVRQLVFLGPAGDGFSFRALLDRDPGATTAKNGTTTAIIGSTGEVVDLRVTVTTSSLTKKKAWTMTSITAPQEPAGSAAPSPSN